MAEQEYEYGFSMDDDPHVYTHSMGVPFSSEDDARRVGEKWYMETLRVYRRSTSQDWDEITNDWTTY